MIQSSKLLSLLISILFFLNLPTAFGKEVINRVLVIVNSDAVLQSDLESLQKRLKQRGAVDETLLLGSPIESLKSDSKLQVDFLIREKLVESEIKKQNFSVTDDRVEQEMNNLAKRGQMSRAEFNKFIVSQGMDLESYKATLKTRIERQSFFESEIVSKLRITDEDAYGEYQNKNPNYRPNVTDFTVAQIFFSPKTGGPKGASERALAVLEKLKSGESFENLANNYDETPSPNKDGVLGSFKSGEFSAELEKVVDRLSKGQVSEVVQTKAGFHIIKVIDKKLTVDPNFLKVKESIKASLVEKNFQRQLRNWFESKKQDAYIQKNESSL